ncbi:GNAT family N-acetyltransferase [Gimesia sp.]|uniref:GNAT family N-acetyltransferase n=1 Tax=Gimesia sp. TaxID=2024833 RepID=UPI003A8FEEAF
MTFDLQPTLSGELLQLRPLQPADYAALYAVASDPLLWEQHPVRTRYQEPVFQELFQKSLESGGALVAIDNSTETIIGSSRFNGYDPHASEIEIGWSFLARSHWGGRYNREMKHLMLQHAFRFVDSVLFLIGPGNIRSQRAMEKISALRDGSRFDQAGCEDWLYRIRATDFIV